MFKKAKTVTSILQTLFSVAIALGVMFVFHACPAHEDGSYMSCHNAQLAVFAVGLGLSVVSVAGVFVKSSAAKKIISVLIALAAAVGAYIPQGIIKLCMMNTMRCHSVMRPAVIVLSIILIIISVVDFVLNLKKEEN
ncbi:MAG: DUF4418 family protein [Firmicutes bacterium]|nr:DUF4418 family protein [Bacillota bacterium]